MKIKMILNIQSTISHINYSPSFELVAFQHAGLLVHFLKEKSIFI